LNLLLVDIAAFRIDQYRAEAYNSQHWATKGIVPHRIRGRLVRDISQLDVQAGDIFGDRHSYAIDFAGRALPIKRIPLFEGMSKKDLTAVARVAEEVEVTSGEVILFQDDSAPAAYVLVTANALVRRNNRKVAELGSGDVVGELALLSDAPRTATVIATSDGTILEVHRRHFLALIGDSPALARRLLAQLANRLAAATMPSRTIERPSESFARRWEPATGPGDRSVTACSGRRARSIGSERTRSRGRFQRATRGA